MPLSLVGPARACVGTPRSTKSPATAASVKVLVTGGEGFIGSNLARALVQRGDDVCTLDNFSTGNRGNLVELAGNVEIVEGELRSYERVMGARRREAPAGCITKKGREAPDRMQLNPFV
jgi:dTDP-D-glucose 4,6-dehydratase